MRETPLGQAQGVVTDLWWTAYQQGRADERQAAGKKKAEAMSTGIKDAYDAGVKFGEENARRSEECRDGMEPPPGGRSRTGYVCRFCEWTYWMHDTPTPRPDKCPHCQRIDWPGRIDWPPPDTRLFKPDPEDPSILYTAKAAKPQGIETDLRTVAALKAEMDAAVNRLAVQAAEEKYGPAKPDDDEDDEDTDALIERLAEQRRQAEASHRPGEGCAKCLSGEPHEAAAKPEPVPCCGYEYAPGATCMKALSCALHGHLGRQQKTDAGKLIHDFDRWKNGATSQCWRAGDNLSDMPKDVTCPVCRKAPGLDPTAATFPNWPRCDRSFLDWIAGLSDAGAERAWREHVARYRTDTRAGLFNLIQDLDGQEKASPPPLGPPDAGRWWTPVSTTPSGRIDEVILALHRGQITKERAKEILNEASPPVTLRPASESAGFRAAMRRVGYVCGFCDRLVWLLPDVPQPSLCPACWGGPGWITEPPKNAARSFVTGIDHEKGVVTIGDKPPGTVSDPSTQDWKAAVRALLRQAIARHASLGRGPEVMSCLSALESLGEEKP